ncbi:MAG: hypothetical protein VX733_10885 [Candidatus Latescibacterota bacterium]|nr:hypothetical protein [Candidatus Latescibacterota bacterium]
MSVRIAQLEDAIREYEKKFLMEKYASMLLLRLEIADLEDTSDGVEIDDRVVKSLRVAQCYVSSEVAEQIEKLLKAQVHNVENLLTEAEGEDTEEPEIAAGSEAVEDQESIYAEGSPNDDLVDDEGVEDEAATALFADIDAESLFDEDGELDGDETALLEDKSAAVEEGTDTAELLAEDSEDIVALTDDADTMGDNSVGLFHDAEDGDSEDSASAAGDEKAFDERDK